MSQLFHVEMLAFCDGELRPVEIDDDLGWPLETLDAIYRNGQNDFQPRPLPSVSVGDVILLGGDDRFLVLPMGFHRLTPAEYEEYKRMARTERAIYARRIG